MRRRRTPRRAGTTSGARSSRKRKVKQGREQDGSRNQEQCAPNPTQADQVRQLRRKGSKRGAGRGRRRSRSAATRRDLWGFKCTRRNPGSTQGSPGSGHEGQPMGIWAHHTTSEVNGSAQHFTEGRPQSSPSGSGASTEDRANAQGSKKGTRDTRQQAGGGQAARRGQDGQVRARRQGGVFR